jgi:uncharacterized protein
MKVSGSATLAASPEAVFAAICDPGALLEVIPGCQEIHQVSADEYRGRIAIRLPAVVGTYDTVVRLVNAEAPTRGELEGRLEGRVGTISGRATFHLRGEDGATVVEYDGSGVVGGPLARLDSRFLEGFARSLVNEGLARLGRRLQAVAIEGAAVR